jgi:hypothetical protein
LSTITEQLIETLEAEIAERRTLITKLKGNRSSGRSAKSTGRHKWTAQQRKKFMSTIRAKKKLETA